MAGNTLSSFICAEYEKGKPSHVTIHKTTASLSVRSSLRDEALKLLDGRGTILELARELSALLRERGITAAVIGGIAVVLHGHVRTTTDIDLLVSDDPRGLAELLVEHGFHHGPARGEFIRAGIPVHFVLPEQTGKLRHPTLEIDGVTTVALADLIEMKLRSGTRNILRAQDLADVIGLIRHRGLDGGFASLLDKSVRLDYRKLVRAISRES